MSTENNENSKIYPRWWKIGYGRLCVSFESNSAYSEVLAKYNPQYIKDDLYMLNISSIKAVSAEKFFRDVNRELSKNYGLDATQLFAKQKPVLVERNLEDLKGFPISECLAVVNYKPPYALAKKNINIVDSLQKIGIETMYDMLFYLPRKYVDRTNPVRNFDNIVIGESIVIMGTVVSSFTSNGKISRTMLKVDVGGGTVIDCVFFRQPWIGNSFKNGSDVVVVGKFNEWNNKPQIMGSSIERNDYSSKPVVPIYKQLPAKGLTSAFFERLAQEVVEELGNVKVPNYMSDYLSGSLSKYFKNIHNPQTMKHVEISSNKLALYELTLLQTVIQHRNDMTTGVSTVKSVSNENNALVETLVNNHLPFTLTSEQQDAVAMVHKEMESGSAQNILLSADVGAGKTIIAQLAALRAVEAGHQAVLAAPTEVLARQLFDKTVALLSHDKEITVEFLSGSIKAKQRKEIEKRVKDGEVDIVVGTHLTLTNSSMYKSLGFVCIDEQHKFGAAQRTAISQSLSSFDGSSPVIMQQTATPIPRSMAQSLFGGMTMIRIRQKPQGRKPIRTKWVNAKPDHVMSKKNNSIWNTMERELNKGNQAFIIAPFVTDSAFMEDVSSVETVFSELKKVFPQRKNKIAMIHGKMKPEAIEETMKKVQNKEYDIIVASTVVEVGVDVPDATFITIMSADRLGIASLHQLRGRVGRNDKQSYCVLVAYEPSPQGVSRLQAMENNNDGFALAEEDLKTRGSGLILGSKQSGESELKFTQNALNPELISVSHDLARSVIFSTDKNIALKDAQAYFGNNVDNVGMNGLLI